MMKRYVLIAGVNGAGKTTLFQTEGIWHDMPRINIDEIVREHGSWQIPKDVFAAGSQAVRMIQSCFEQGISFNQETTLCGKGILKNINYAKEHGYHVELFFVGLESSDIAKQRVAQRVRDGGHGVPEADIERRYTEGMNHLLEVLPLCDTAEIYDNTHGFRRLAVYENGRCINRETYLPDWFTKLCDREGK